MWTHFDLSLSLLGIYCINTQTYAYKEAHVINFPKLLFVYNFKILKIAYVVIILYL